MIVHMPISQDLEEIVEVLQLTLRNLRLHGVKIIQVQSLMPLRVLCKLLR